MDSIYMQLAVELDSQTFSKIKMVINAIGGTVEMFEDSGMIVLEIKYDPAELAKITGNSNMLYFFA